MEEQLFITWFELTSLCKIANGENCIQPFNFVIQQKQQQRPSQQLYERPLEIVYRPMHAPLAQARALFATQKHQVQQYCRRGKKNNNNLIITIILFIISNVYPLLSMKKATLSLFDMNTTLTQSFNHINFNISMYFFSSSSSSCSYI